MSSQRRGVTLIELVVCIGIIGILSFLVPILIRLFNNLAYLQQKSLMQKEAKAVLWQMSHEVANSVRVEVNPGTGCINTTAGECLGIWTYNYDQYTDQGKYENPAMYKFDPLNPAATFGLIVYSVVQETPGNDYDKNGHIDSLPYLLKRTFWPASDPRWPESQPQAFLKGRILQGSATVKPDTFLDYGSAQIFKVTLKLRSSYDKSNEPARLVSTVLTMTSQPAW